MLHHSIFYQNKSILKYYVTIRKLQWPPNKIDNFDIAIKQKSYIYIYNRRVTNCSPNPKELGYKPNKPNTINL